MIIANPFRVLRDVFLMTVALFALGYFSHRYGMGTAPRLVIVSLQGILVGGIVAATILSIRRPR